MEQVEKNLGELRFSAYQERLKRTCKNIEKETTFSNYNPYTMPESVNGQAKRILPNSGVPWHSLKAIKCDH